MKKKHRNNKTKKLLLIGMCISTVLMAAGYAAFQTRLQISNIGKIYKACDIKFTKATLAEDKSTLKKNEDGLAEETTPPVISLDGYTIDVAVELNSPNDRMVYEIDITNFSVIAGEEYFQLDIAYDEPYPFIIWNVLGLNIGDTINKDTKRTIELVAYWDYAKYYEIPEDAIKKESETEFNQTHTEKATITLTFVCSGQQSEEEIAPIPDVPMPEFAFTETEWTNQDVTVTLEFLEPPLTGMREDNEKPFILFAPYAGVTIINNGGSNQYTFKKNGSFTFLYGDTAGRQGRATATVNNIDKTPPVITSAGNPKENTFTNENVTITPVVYETDSGFKSFLWNINGGSWQENFPGTFSDEMIATIGIVALDNAGNQSAPVYTQIKINKTTPIITLVGDEELTQEVHKRYYEMGAKATDQYGNNITKDIIISGSVNTSIVGTYYIYYDVVDAAGNTVRAERKINIVDTTPPVLTIKPDVMTLDQYGSFDLMSGVTAIDNYDGDITSKVVVTPSSSNWNVVTAATITRVFTYSITDINGNNTTKTRTITMIDKEAPVITVNPGNIYVMEVNTPSDGHSKPVFNATASDNVDPSVVVVITDDININKVGTYTVTFTATDVAGNTSITTRSFTVRDTTPPVITLEGSSTMTLEVHSAYTEPGWTAFDHYDGDVSTKVVVTTNLNTSIVNTYWVSYNVVDAAGNIATQRTRTIIIEDTTAPIITIAYPEGKDYVVVEKGTPYDLMDGVSAWDNYDGDITSRIIRSHNSIDTTHTGMYYINYDVVDAHGNNAIRQTKAIKVSTQPTITITGNTSMEVNTPLDPHSLPSLSATAVDSLGASVPVVITGIDAININKTGTYSLTYTATDVDGKTRIVTGNFYVRDTQAPEFTFLGADYHEIPSGVGYAEEGWSVFDFYSGAEDITIALRVTTSSGTQIFTGTTTADIVPAWDPIPAPYKSTPGVYFLYYTVSETGGINSETYRREIVVYGSLPTIYITMTNVYTMEVNTPTNAHSIPSFGATALDRFGATIPVIVTHDINSDVPGAYTVTFTATDAYDATRVETMAFTVLHSRGPVITLTPQGGLINLTMEAGSVYIEPGATAFDDYDRASTYVNISTNLNPNVPGVYTVTYTSTDSKGNTSVSTRTVTVLDTTPPVITFDDNPLEIPQNALVDVMFGVHAIDDVDGNITHKVMATPISVSSSWPGYHTITYTVKDNAGNQTVETRQIRIIDVTPPVITVDPTNVYVMEVDTPTDHHTIPVFKATANDNVDGSVPVIINHDIIPGTVGTYTVTFTSTDAHFNVAVETRSFTVQDSTPPELTILALTMNLSQGGTFDLMDGVSAFDHYDGDITEDIIVTPSSSDWNTLTASTITRVFTYSVTDANGNNTTKTRTITMIDTESPVITIDPGNIYVMEVDTPTDSHSKPAFNATAVDNVDPMVSVIVTDDIDINTVGTYTVTFTAVDAAGNTATVTKPFVVEDTTPPVITILEDEITIEVLTFFNAMSGVSAFDHYDKDVTAYIGVTGTVTNTIPGTYYIKYDVKDSSLNSAIQKTKTVHVVNTLPPVLTIETPTMNLNQGGTFDLMSGVSAVDSYGNDLTEFISVDPISSDWNTLTSSSITRVFTYSVTDKDDNTTTKMRTITMIDTEEPLITPSGGNVYKMEVNTPLDSHSKPILTATATDNVDSSVSVSVSDNIDINTVGSYSVIFKATDSAGNIATETRAFIVEDTTPPVITLTNSEETIEVHTLFDATIGVSAYDFYDKDLTSKISITGLVTPGVLGTYYINYNVTDSSLNAAAQKTKTVHVVDTTPPVLTITPTTMTLNQYDSFNLMSGVSAVDNYDGSITSNIIVTPSSSDWNTLTAGTITRIFNYSITDSSGNISTGSRTITMIDKEAPIITIDPGNTYTMEVNTSLDPHSKPVFEATAMDNVDGSISVAITDNININAVGTYTITFKATDNAGNITTETKSFTVVDTTPPVITLIGSMAVTIEVHSIYTDAGATAYDYYDGNITGNIIVSGKITPGILGTYYIYYDVKDSSNNSATTVTRTVNVVDTTPPVITINPSNVYTMEVNTPIDAHTKPVFNATALDNYDGSTGVIITDDININTIGTYTITFKATDTSANTKTETRAFTVQDTTGPIITIDIGNTYTMVASSNPGDIPIFNATANDYYDGPTYVNITHDINSNVPGSYTVTFKATDTSGNATTLTRAFTVT